MDLVQELNYDCNRDLFLIYFNMKKKIQNREEQSRISEWIKKIMKCNKKLSDIRLRNDFMDHLARNVENGRLDPPFNLEPPRQPLKVIAKQLPIIEDSPTNDEDTLLLRLLPAKHGGFLLPKPLPRIGAYCYIAALNDD